MDVYTQLQNSLAGPIQPNVPFPVPFPTLSHAVIPFVLTFPFWITFYGGMQRYSDYMQSVAWRGQDQNVPEEFDFIIVGGGSSGCVLANRLSENYSVLLLELGGDPNPISRIGLSYYVLQRVPSTDLLYETLPQTNAALALHNQKVFWPRGTGLGGSSNLNAMIYQRGNPNDYDNWANITGDRRWSFRNVLPYFKKLEDYKGPFPNAKIHGSGGPMHIETVKQSYMEKYFLDAAREKGFPIKDVSGSQSSGFSPNVVTMKDGLRWGTFQGYINPIKNRDNLRIYRYSRVVKVHLNKDRHAEGVTYARHGRRRFVRARKEVILSAGAVDTPKILMLSGIGPKEHLTSVGVKCLVDLPVGQNLHDHPMTLLGPIRVDTPESLLLGRATRVRSAVDFIAMRQGPLASTTHSGVGFVSTSVRNHDNSWPDIQFTMASFGVIRGMPELMQQIFNIKADTLREYFREGEGNGDEQEKDGNMIAVALQRPKSRGYIKLASRDPFMPPLIQPNYFSHPDDMKAYVEGVRILVDMFENTTVYRRINARLLKPFPGCESVPFKSDDYYECYIRHLTTTIYHPVGTASMGKGLEDKNAVVDPQLRVLRTTGLRVVDASIMPEIPNANTNIPCIMIAEVASDFIIKHWQSKSRICHSDLKDNFLTSEGSKCNN